MIARVSSSCVEIVDVLACSDGTLFAFECSCERKLFIEALWLRSDDVGGRDVPKAELTIGSTGVEDALRWRGEETKCFDAFVGGERLGLSPSSSRIGETRLGRRQAPNDDGTISRSCDKGVSVFGDSNATNNRVMTGERGDRFVEFSWIVEIPNTDFAVYATVRSWIVLWSLAGDLVFDLDLFLFFFGVAVDVAVEEEGGRFQASAETTPA